MPAAPRDAAPGIVALGSECLTSAYVRRVVGLRHRPFGGTGTPRHGGPHPQCDRQRQDGERRPGPAPGPCEEQCDRAGDQHSQTGAGVDDGLQPRFQTWWRGPGDGLGHGGRGEPGARPGENDADGEYGGPGCRGDDRRPDRGACSCRDRDGTCAPPRGAGGGHDDGNAVAGVAAGRHGAGGGGVEAELGPEGGHEQAVGEPGQAIAGRDQRHAGRRQAGRATGSARTSPAPVPHRRSRHGPGRRLPLPHALSPRLNRSVYRVRLPAAG